MKVAVIGGSREADILEQALKDAGIGVDPSGETAIIAAHPFDTDLWKCSALSVAHKPHIGLVRPAWQPELGDDWRMAPSAARAAQVLAESGAKCALLAVGNSRLLPFYRMKNIALCVRSRNAPHPPEPPSGTVRATRGPFDVKEEIAELQANGIDALVVHNAGGAGGLPKLLAARSLGIPVVMIERPKRPQMEILETVEGALAWAKRHMRLDD